MYPCYINQKKSNKLFLRLVTLPHLAPQVRKGCFSTLVALNYFRGRSVEFCLFQYSSPRMVYLKIEIFLAKSKDRLSEIRQ